MTPSPIGTSKSPASSMAAALVSTTTRARRTVSESTSRVCGWKLPTAFTCAPSASRAPSKSGLGRGRAGADDVGGPDRIGVTDHGVDPAGQCGRDEWLRTLAGSAHDGQLTHGPHRGHRVQVGASLHTRPEDHEATRITASQQTRREPAHRGRAERRERRAVDQ